VLEALLLDRERTFDGGDDGRKLQEHAVAHRLDDAPAEAGDDRPRLIAMLANRPRRARLVFPHQARIADDIEARIAASLRVSLISRLLRRVGSTSRRFMTSRNLPSPVPVSPMHVDVSTELNCSAAKAWDEVQKSSLLLRVIWPLARITPTAASGFPERWSEGLTVQCKSFVFGFIRLASGPCASKGRPDGSRAVDPRI